MTKKLTILILIIVIGLASFTVFFRLGENHLSTWDESRYAVNSIEMINSQDPFIVTFDGKPDYWNSKPPMAIWLMSISLKTIGYSEIGVRTPSAIAFILTIILLLLFSKTIIKNYIPGVLASLTMICTTGILRYHGARNGDVDSLLTLFILGYVLSYFSLLIQNKNRTLLFGLLVTSVIFAFLTKGIAALVPLVGLFFCTFLFRKFIVIIKSWQLYASIALFLIVGIGYYLLRNHYDPKYLEAVFKQDLGIFNSQSNKTRHFFFYIDQIINNHFYPYAIFLPISITLAFFTKEIRIKKTILYATITTITFLLIHSFSKTKNEWYDMPIYPLISMIFGYSLFVIHEILTGHIKGVSNKTINIITTVCVLLIFGFRYNKTVINMTSHFETYHRDLEGDYMKDLHKRKPDIKEYSIAIKGYTVDDQPRFYIYAFNKELNYNVKFNRTQNFDTGKIVLVCNKTNQNNLESNYKYTILDSTQECRLYRIDSIK